MPEVLALRGSSIALTCVLAFLAGAHAQEPEPKGGYRMLAEQSPYLRQHANDPVEWRAWNDAAFAEARKLGRPVFLSIGYAACHWCHVMQRESFQDADSAAALNRFTIPIKVDREERPDVDRVYIEACRRMSSGGCGWPLTVFLTADREPFFVGTYFPPEDRGPRRGFKAILADIEKLWADRREDAVAHARKVSTAMREEHAAAARDFAVPSRELVEEAVAVYAEQEDRVHGGLGTAPKFPSPSSSLLMLRAAARAGKASDAQAVKRLLDALLAGGIRDHLAGGFHRYSTDAEWKVPHFEKMLYDQALLAVLFLEGAAAFSEPRYAAGCAEILEWCLRDLRDANGGFYAALDADTGGVEGATFTWTLAGLKAALSDAEAAVVIAWCGATEAGNWEEGRNVLYEAKPPGEVAAALERPADAVRKDFESARRKMLAARSKRPQPRTDTKVLSGWNALMISALAKAASAGIPGTDGKPAPWLERALETARLLESKFFAEDGALLRSLAGGKARHPAELADYGALLNAWLDLHEATLDRAWLARAEKLAVAIDARFGRKDDGGFVDSREQDVLFETQDLFDGAWPSGTALTLVGLVRLADLAGGRWLERARSGLHAIGAKLASQPAASPHVLIALDLALGPTARVDVLGSGDPAALFAPLRRGYWPFAALTVPPPDEDSRSGSPRALVCTRAACLEPATTAEQLEARLREALRADAPR